MNPGKRRRWRGGGNDDEQLSLDTIERTLTKWRRKKKEKSSELICKFSGFLGLQDAESHSPSLTPVWWQFLKHSIKYRVDGRLLLAGEGRFKDGSFIHEVGSSVVRTSTLALCLAVCVPSVRTGQQSATRSCLARTQLSLLVHLMQMPSIRVGLATFHFYLIPSFTVFVYLFIYSFSASLCTSAAWASCISDRSLFPMWFPSINNASGPRYHMRGAVLRMHGRPCRWVGGVCTCGDRSLSEAL